MKSIYMQLDKIDKKIVHYIYHNYREPLTKIAKACKISREQVEYRLKKYENNGLIKKYLAMFNYNALGYQDFVILKLKVLQNSKQELFTKISHIKNCISVFTSIGDYNLCVNFAFKDKSEFEDIFYGFLKANKTEISKYDIFFATYLEFYPLKFIDINDIERSNYKVTGQEQPLKITKKDIKVLKELEINGRAKLIDISRKTGIPSDLLVYKLKKFRSNKLIQGFRLQLDLTKLGINFAIYYVRLDNNTKNIRSKLISFSENHRNLNGIGFGISYYNCIIQIAYGNEHELKKTVNDIEEIFSEYYSASNLLLVESESTANMLPF